MIDIDKLTNKVDWWAKDDIIEDLNNKAKLTCEWETTTETEEN